MAKPAGDAIEQAFFHSIEVAAHHVGELGPVVGAVEVGIYATKAFVHLSHNDMQGFTHYAIESVNASLGVMTDSMYSAALALLDVKTSMDRWDIGAPASTPQELMERAIEACRGVTGDNAYNAAAAIHEIQSFHYHAPIDSHSPPTMELPSGVTVHDVGHFSHTPHHHVASFDWGHSGGAIQAAAHGPGHYSDGTVGYDANVLIGGHHYSVDLSHTHLTHVMPVYSSEHNAYFDGSGSTMHGGHWDVQISPADVSAFNHSHSNW